MWWRPVALCAGSALSGTSPEVFVGDWVAISSLVARRGATIAPHCRLRHCFLRWDHTQASCA